MKKTAQLVKEHLKGRKTEASKEVMNKISKKLEEAGFKPPFKMKLAGNGPDVVFDSELPDGRPVTVTAYIHPEEHQTRWDPGSPEEIEIFLYFEDTGKEIPEEILRSLPGFENYMSNLQMEASERHTNRADFDADRKLDEMRDLQTEREHGMI